MSFLLRPILLFFLVLTTGLVNAQSSALDSLSLITEIDSGDNSASYHYKMAIAYQEKEEDESALIEIRRAIEMNARIPDYFLLQGQIQEKLGMLEEALGSYEAGLQIDKKNCPLLVNRGGLFHQLTGNENKALKDYTKCLNHQKSYVNALANRAAIYLIQGDVVRAKKDVLCAYGLAPQDPEIVILMGYLLEETGDADSAIHYYDLCIQLDEFYEPAYISKAEALRFIEDNVQSAIEVLDQYILLDSIAIQVRIERAMYRAELEHYRAALRDIHTCIKYAPYDAILYAMAGDYYYVSGSYSSAIEYYTKAIDIESDKTNLSNYYLYRGLTYHQIEKRMEACSDIALAANAGNEQAIQLMVEICE